MTEQTSMKEYVRALLINANWEGDAGKITRPYWTGQVHAYTEAMRIIDEIAQEVSRKIANIDDSQDPENTQWEKAGYVAGLNYMLEALIGKVKP